MSLIDPVDEEKLIALAEAAIARLVDKSQAALIQAVSDKLMESLRTLLDERQIVVEFKTKENL